MINSREQFMEVTKGMQDGVGAGACCFCTSMLTDHVHMA